MSSSTNDSQLQFECHWDLELVRAVTWAIIFILLPAVAFLGVFVNGLSVVVLAKQGLKKCFNILLMALAVSDLSYILGSNSLLKYLHFSGQVEGLAFSEEVSTFLFYLFNVTDILNWGGGTTSMGLPILITLERFIAVYFPLNFHTIVTPRRTLTAVLTVYCFCFGLQLYARSWYQFAYNFNYTFNVSMGTVQKSSFFFQQQAVSNVIETLYTAAIFPFSFVTIACVAIGVKVKLSTVHRTRMMSLPRVKQGRHMMSRTTRNLMSMCAVYGVACLLVSLQAIVPLAEVNPVLTKNHSVIADLLFNILQLVLSINAAFNFLIYVAVNKKFRTTLLHILGLKKWENQNNVALQRIK